MTALTPDRIMSIANAFMDSSTLFAASDAGVFAKLAELQAADASTLATELKLDQRAAALLLHACVAAGLLVKREDKFVNTPEADQFLVPGRPGDLSAALRYNRDVVSAWQRAGSFVRDGRPVERPELHLGADRDRTRTFVLSMHYRALAIGRCAVHMFDLTGRRSLLDVGGGPGTYAVLFARAYPGLTATVLDLPDVTAIAGELIGQQGASNLVRTCSGDYRTTSFPPGADVIHFFGMLHQESPESIVRLFHKAYDCLPSGGLVHIMDMMTDRTRSAPKYSALFAMNMALTTESGWVFSDEDLTGWLRECGFVDIAVTPLPAPMPHWIAKARKP